MYLYKTMLRSKWSTAGHLAISSTLFRGIVCLKHFGLTLICLREGIATLLSHALHLSYFANRLLGHCREYGVSEFLKYCCAYSRSSICEDGCSSNGHGCASNSSKIDIHGINNAFEVERYLHVEHLHILSMLWMGWEGRGC